MEPKKGHQRNIIPVVAVIIGSKSDAEQMAPACEILKQFGVPFEFKVLSAHRTPDHTLRYAEEAESRGFEVIIAGAGGAAHLPGIVAAKTTLPVIGVPVKSKALQGLDSLLSMVQMPSGVPVATVAIDGATNAGLLAIRILSLKRTELTEKLRNYSRQIEEQVLKTKL